jgi:hypothetical protein
MKALISGRAGRALIIEGQTLRSLDIKDPWHLVERRHREVPFLFGDARDIRIVENGNLESIHQQLQEDSKFTLGLDLALISLDAELPAGIRLDALSELEDALDSPRIAERLENILYAAPLPDDADIDGACELAATTECELIRELLISLSEAQPVIAEVANAWDAIPTKSFGGPEARLEFQHTAICEGLSRSLVQGIRTTHNATALVGELNKTHIQQLSNHELVMQQWTSGLASIKLLSQDEVFDEHGRLVARERQLIVDVLKAHNDTRSARTRVDLEAARLKNKRARSDDATATQEEQTH